VGWGEADTVEIMVVSFRRYETVQTGPIGERMIAFFEKYYPHSTELYVTSGKDGDHGPRSHHYGDSYLGSPTAAIDFGGYDDPEPNDKDQRDMGLAADWLYEHFSDLTAELIHTQPHNDHVTYVKNQIKVPPYAVADHVNHIHWATSMALMDDVEARARSLWPAGGNGDGPPSPGNDVFHLPDGHYYGLIDGPAESHGGFFPAERPVVKLIQQRLQALGFAPASPGWADGLFERPTEAAVKSFQSANGLPADGRVRRLTWSRLFDPDTVVHPPPTPAGVLFGCDIYDFTVNQGLTEDHVRGMVQNGGLVFINAKFWEQTPSGTTIPHLKSTRMLRVATEAGLQFPCGFVVPRTGVEPEVVVTNLLNYADANYPVWREHPDFFWQVDTEWWWDEQTRSYYDKVDINLGAAVTRQLMRMSRKPAILYASQGHYRDTVPNFPGRKMWNANYNRSGASRDYREMYLGNDASGWVGYSGTTPVINQYCSDGKVNGWGPLPMSAFRGNADDFRKMLREAIAPYKSVNSVASHFDGGGQKGESLAVVAGTHKHGPQPAY